MTIEEQNAYLTAHYVEAMRYMENAEGFLRMAKRDGPRYTDKKYVRTACGTAYNGVLIALDAWLSMKGVAPTGKKKRKSIEYYKTGVARLDGKLLSVLDNVYIILHLEGYYDGSTNVKAISGGFEEAYEIIDKIKPYAQ
ncbi:MAG: DUF5618 family protein [Chitinispirillales bacterium]|jgi:hypothetical protein|nr:DUF5618 family protein [Chitinispirillales bacterium]